MTTHLDVLIVGAGLSGVGSAVHLTKQCPWAEFAVLDAFDGHGGTWRSNTYPGARSDTDLFTYGFSFKPWEGAPIARGGPIRDYIGEVIDEHGLQDRIHYSRKVTAADWSSEESHWVVTAISRDGRTERYTATFLWMCQGYYRHLEGYIPDWPGMSNFSGDVLHPQRWPQGYDCSGKRVLVIGSGATAVTIIPALADTAAHVTQLQRSPTYFVAAPNENELATRLRKLDIPKEWIHEIVRQQVLSDHDEWVKHSLANPEDAKRDLLAGVREALGGQLTDDFVPQYKPWRQRVCYVPDNDYFDAIRSGTADVVTDEIDAFLSEGVRLKSGAVLEADVIVTATGFNVSAFGDIAISQDEVPFDMRNTVTYRGILFTETPNLAWIVGYFRSAPYTLRVDLVGAFVCRLLNHMRRRGVTVVTPRLRPEDADMVLLPYLDTEEFNPGYVQRAANTLPRRGDKHIWRHSQDYWADKADLCRVDFSEEPLHFQSQPAVVEAAG